jgi:putative phosphoesterase
MRVGILSDTHDQRLRTATAVRILVAEGAEALIHCGDLTGPDIVYECCHLPSFYVLGNNDHDAMGLQRVVADLGGTWLGRGGEVVLDGCRIAATHGDSEREMRRLAESGPDYLLFGHSHRCTDERVGTTRLINPGALHRAPLWTVALLDLQSDVLRFLKLNKK